MTSRWNRARGGGAPSPICFLADDGPENSKSARLYTRRHDGEEPFGERYHPISSLRQPVGGRSSATRRAAPPSPPVLPADPGERRETESHSRSPDDSARRGNAPSTRGSRGAGRFRRRGRTDPGI